MKILNRQLRLAATDVSNHLACRHLTQLELAVVRGERPAPEWAAPDLKVIQELGLRHEKAYLNYLEEKRKLSVVRLSEKGSDKDLIADTLRLMEEGAEVIAQGALGNAQWFGRPDVLLKVDKPAGRWKWSYQVQDTKLARETKATTILQLSLYSELLEALQGCAPEAMWVIPPAKDFGGEEYRVAEYAAYYRSVKRELLRATNGTTRPAAQGTLFEMDRRQLAAKVDTYPEPVEHCNVCRWFQECEAQRRADDHLSLVAGIRRQQRNQLMEWQRETVAKLAALPTPLKAKPRHGSREGMERVREQARVQVEGREEQKLKFEPIVPVVEETGFFRLPEPSAGDMFVDLEGDPFAGEQGHQYLFGFVWRNANGELVYDKRWALTSAEEKSGFEWLIDEIMRRRETEPGMRVYHFGAYEPGTLKRLMGIYATREEEIDTMLWEGTFVDLHQVFKQGLRASVEEYSLKKLEAFYGFERKTPLEESRVAMRYVEHRLELGWKDEQVPEEIREVMEGYNGEDCLSTAELREWLEKRRQELVDSGISIARPAKKERPAQEELTEWQERVAALGKRLTNDVPVDGAERSHDQQTRWLMAQLLDWHRRESKATHWDGFRLKDLDELELLEDRAGLGGLEFLKRLRVDRKIPVDRYSFEKQETEAREDSELFVKGEKFGVVVAIDPISRTVDVKKTRKSAETHPTGAYVWKWPFNTKEQREALFRIGAWIAGHGLDANGDYRAARDLLLRRPPRLFGNEKMEQRASETPVNTAIRVGSTLQNSIFAIQGPPGSGKTYTGARMICELINQGKTIGVTALSHKVIRNLLDAVVEAAREKDAAGVCCLHRDDDGEPSDGVKVALENNDEAHRALRNGAANVVGGTSWLWAPDAAFGAVDVLFIDEAGQMSLADVLSVAHAGKSLVLLGDPQQLERPLQGSHPDGAENSALEHLLNGHKTIPAEMGFLLPETWRLHPAVCKFTSELFYENKLSSHAIARSRVMEGHPWVKGAGLWFVPVEHEGNRNSSAEEAEAVAKIVEGLLAPSVKWFYSAGNSATLKPEKDILIVAPYNAQVADLSARLPEVRVGTVDKFQGQEAAVVIYSLTTSSLEDAPRGMEFLYSLNRLNVATSRAKTAVIVVGSPKLFEPECRSPRQMQLANALCAYLEMAETVKPEAW